MNKQTEKKQRLTIYQKITAHLAEINTGMQIKTETTFIENRIIFDITVFNKTRTQNCTFYFFAHHSIQEISKTLKRALESIKTNDYDAIKKQAALQ